MEVMERVANNKVALAGVAKSEFKFDHEFRGESFYTLDVECSRSSGFADVLPVIVSERLVDVNGGIAGKNVMIGGQFRSYSQYDNNGKSRLVLYVFAQSFEVSDEPINHMNTISLNGYIGKPPVHRFTALKNDIADVMLSVPRAYEKTDYIPCVFWGRNAKYISGFGVGTYITAEGRIQSRKYVKRISETECVNRMVYEVSVSAFNVIQDDGGKESEQS